MAESLKGDGPITVDGVAGNPERLIELISNGCCCCCRDGNILKRDKLQFTLYKHYSSEVSFCESFLDFCYHVQLPGRFLVISYTRFDQSFEEKYTNVQRDQTICHLSGLMGVGIVWCGGSNFIILSRISLSKMQHGAQERSPRQGPCARREMLNVS